MVSPKDESHPDHLPAGTSQPVVPVLVPDPEATDMPVDADAEPVARPGSDARIADLAATGWERFSVGQFKDRFGLSRKWAIPLLEHLDSRGVTRRIGDERQLRRS